MSAASSRQSSSPSSRGLGRATQDGPTEVQKKLTKKAFQEVFQATCRPDVQSTCPTSCNIRPATVERSIITRWYACPGSYTRHLDVGEVERRAAEGRKVQKEFKGSKIGQNFTTCARLPKASFPWSRAVAKPQRSATTQARLSRCSSVHLSETLRRGVALARGVYHGELILKPMAVPSPAGTTTCVRTK